MIFYAGGNLKTQIEPPLFHVLQARLVDFVCLQLTTRCRFKRFTGATQLFKFVTLLTNSNSVLMELRASGLLCRSQEQLSLRHCGCNEQ